MDPKVDYKAGGPLNSDIYTHVGRSLILYNHLLDMIEELAPPCEISTTETGELRITELKGVCHALRVSYTLIVQSHLTKHPCHFDFS